MKVLVDMNLSPRWVGLIKRAGFVAEHWSELGRPDASDAAIMAHAKMHGHVVLTHDLDFGSILAATQGTKPSVVQLRCSDVRPEVVGDQVLAALVQMADELAAGALLTVDLGRSRLSVLPLRTGI